jgi:cobalt-zinc-cadmium efflux system outer membrane protein
MTLSLLPYASRRRGGWLALALASTYTSLTGCTPASTGYSPAYLPGYRPSELPPAYGRSAATTLGGNSHSEAPAALGQPVPLQGVIQLSVTSDPRIKSALASLLVARAESVAAAVLPNPELTISQTLNPFPGHPFTPALQGGPPQLDVGLSYALDTILFGKRSAAMESAQRSIEAAAAEYAEVVRQRVREAVVAFYDVLQAQALVELTRESYTQIKKLEDITTQRVALGSVGSIEQDRVKLAVLAAHRELLRSETELAKARSRLAVRMGAPASTPASIQGSLECKDPKPPPALPDLLAIADSARPDLLAARRQIQKAHADLQLERSRGYPELSVSAGVTRQFQNRAIGMPDVSAWGVGVGTTLPIFDRNQGGVAQAEAAWRQAQSQLTATAVEARVEVEQALQEYTLAYTLITSGDTDILRAATSARDRIQEAYRLGGRTLIEVLDAQEAYRQTMRLLIETRADYWRALHMLNAAVGQQVLS